MQALWLQESGMERRTSKPVCLHKSYTVILYSAISKSSINWRYRSVRDRRPVRVTVQRGSGWQKTHWSVTVRGHGEMCTNHARDSIICRLQTHSLLFRDSLSAFVFAFLLQFPNRIWRYETCILSKTTASGSHVQTTMYIHYIISKTRGDAVLQLQKSTAMLHSQNACICQIVCNCISWRKKCAWRTSTRQIVMRSYGLCVCVPVVWFDTLLFELFKFAEYAYFSVVSSFEWICLFFCRKTIM